MFHSGLFSVPCNCEEELVDRISSDRAAKVEMQKIEIVRPNHSNKYKLFVQILSTCFGFGSWIAMTGLWVELPLLTQKLPESWSLGSFLTVMIQLANIGPLIYWWARTRRICSEVTAIHLQMAVGTVSCLALIFWWDTTAMIFGKERSIVLYLASFGLSIVDCTSSVVFLPYMARFKAHHMTPYLIGEGLSGFLPSLVALAQGVTDDGGQECQSSNSNVTSDVSMEIENMIREPRFSANVFFCFLLFILLISWIAFACMDWLKVCQEERIDLNPKDDLSEAYTCTCSCASSSSCTCAQVKMLHTIKLDGADEAIAIPISTKSRLKYFWLLGLMGWGCFTTFGAMPSLQSYSCLPYGSEPFFYAVTLAGLAYPAACLFGLFVDIRSSKLINSLTIIGSVIAIYIITCAVMSPNPPLETKKIGSVLIVTAWFIYVAMISYAKTMVSLELNDLGGNQAMFWCGFAQQFGAASGGALIFCIINFTNIFTEENNCDV